jgi:pimeloyl-ACP methyl ester carboxylesterase
LLESLSDILADKFSPGAVGMAGSWLSDKVSDPLIEKTIGRPFARPLWSEMKENAELAAASGRGGDLLTDALRALASSWGDKFELHLIGHSAGSIILGRLLGDLTQKGLTDRVQSMHLYAPACTVAFADEYYAPQAEIMGKLHLDILSDQRERDDNVASIYRKSLLYFVSNALEADLRMPILGLANVYNPSYSDWDGSSNAAEALTRWRNVVETSNLADRLMIHDEEKIVTRRGNGADQQEKTESASHGGFDNDVDIVGKTLERITGATLELPVDDLVGF